jgi:two-component system nitrogen regulation response regulator NtrX
MPHETQGKILRTLQEGAFTRVGGTRKVEIDVRVIAASNHNLPEEIAAGRLREDLYYRLNVVPIRIPELSERREDIPELCRYFLRRAAEANGLPARELAEDALATLQVYDWPGNVRELRNMMEWLAIMVQSEASSPINAGQLPGDILYSNPLLTRPETNSDIMSLALREARELFEKQYLAAQIDRFGGNISRTSNFIGMERSALHRKLKMLGIHASEEKVAG